MKILRVALASLVAALAVTASVRSASARALDYTHSGPGMWPPSTDAIAKGSSPVPTVAEWNAAPEVGVTKSTQYHCETKLVREWFRSSCVAYDKWTLLPAKAKQGVVVGDQIFFWNDPGGQKASVVMQVRQGYKYIIQFNWAPGPTPSDLTIDLKGPQPLAWFN